MSLVWRAGHSSTSCNCAMEICSQLTVIRDTKANGVVQASSTNTYPIHMEVTLAFSKLTT